MSDPITKIYSGRIDLTDRNSSWTKIVELVGHSKELLEVGCAQGYMSEFLSANRQCRVTGVEINRDAARHAAPFCVEMIVGDVEDRLLERINRTFDVIIFADVLEHLRDPWAVLHQSHHLLRPGGYVLLSLPNVTHWEVRRDILRGRFDYTPHGILDSGHLRFFTYKTAADLIHNAGFQIDTFDVVFRGPRHWRYQFYRRWERQLNHLVKRFCPGLFAFQLIFKARPVVEAHERRPSYRDALAPRDKR